MAGEWRARGRYAVAVLVVSIVPAVAAADEEPGEARLEAPPEMAVPDVDTARLKVKVSDESGNRIGGVRVIVIFDDEKEAKRRTDDDGVALMPDLPLGKATIIVTADGHKSRKQVLELDAPCEMLEFVLQPDD